MKEMESLPVGTVSAFVRDLLSGTTAAPLTWRRE